MKRDEQVLRFWNFLNFFRYPLAFNAVNWYHLWRRRSQWPESPAGGEVSAGGEEQSSPSIFQDMVNQMNETDISVFVDESGTFDSDEDSSRFYLICLVIHDQRESIARDVAALEDSLLAIGLGRDHCIHAGPLIRRELGYADMTRDDRRRIMARMMAFVRRAPYSYKCFALDKKFVSTDTAIHDFLLQHIVRFLIDNADMFNGYGRIKVYYDNGQRQIKAILSEAFSIFASKTVFVSDVHPDGYRLFQVADVLCTLELIRHRLIAGGRLTRSEYEFFNGFQNLNRNYFKVIARKQCR